MEWQDTQQQAQTSPKHRETLNPTPTLVVLGAGPSGLGTALGMALNSRASGVWILEKKATPGGLSGSFSWKDHRIDFGPHRLSPNLLSTRVLAEELLGPDCLIKKSQHGVQLQGRLYQFPPRLRDWLLPTSLWTLFRFGLSFFVGKVKWIVRRFGPDDFESTIEAKFGRYFFDTIASPMCEKVWISSKEIDPSFVNQRFGLVHPLEILKKVIFPSQELNPTSFYYPRGGFQQLWTNLSDYLRTDGQHLLYNTPPTSIDVKNNRVMRVGYDDEGTSRWIEGSHLEVVSTIPIFKLLQIIKGFSIEPLLEKSRQIRTKSMFLVAFEFNQPRTLPFRTLIFPEKAFWFNRLFEQNEYSRDTVNPDKSIVVADITYPHGGEETAMTDDEIVAKTRGDLKRLSYIDSTRISDVRVERVEFAYVVPDLRSRRLFHEIQYELKKIPNLHLVGRFSNGEYDNSDYAIDHGLTLGATLSGRVSKLDYLFAQHSKRGRNIVG